MQKNYPDLVTAKMAKEYRRAKGFYQLVSERLFKDNDLRVFLAGPGKTDSFRFPLHGKN